MYINNNKTKKEKMKKLSYLMIALVCAMFVACSSCKSEKEVTPVNKAMSFNEALLMVNLDVLKQYPSAQFYEAQGFLVPADGVEAEVDGTIDASQFRVAYNFMDTDRQKTIIGSFNEDMTVKVEVINDIWCEDIVTTPYVPMTAADAIEMINAQLDEQLEAGPITLRHQLYPGEAEPRYFIGSLDKLHTINVYTGKIDVPAGGDNVADSLAVE